jgi:hypothetical protein
MTRKLDSITEELPLGARTRVRLPEAASGARIFPGWGPGLGR